MASKYSVAKRGKVYYLRHRITPDGRQVWVSLKTPEQREAYRKAKSFVRDAEQHEVALRLDATNPRLDVFWSRERTSNSTANRYLGLMGWMYSLANEWQVYDKNSAHRVKKVAERCHRWHVNEAWRPCA